MPDRSTARPAAVMRPGTRPDGPTHGAWRQASDLGDVAIERDAVDGEVIELLLEELGRDAIEEHIDRKHDDDEVVETADERDAVWDEIATEDEVARGRPEHDLALGRHPLVEDERPDQPRVVGDAARDGQEREQRHDAPDARPSVLRLLATPSTS